MPDSFSIDGPVAVVLFQGDVKKAASALNYVAACWLDLDRTLIAVKLAGNTPPAHAKQMLEHDLDRRSIRVAYSATGCDVKHSSLLNN